MSEPFSTGAGGSGTNAEIVNQGTLTVAPGSSLGCSVTNFGTVSVGAGSVLYGALRYESGAVTGEGTLNAGRHARLRLDDRGQTSRDRRSLDGPGILTVPAGTTLSTNATINTSVTNDGLMLLGGNSIVEAPLTNYGTLQVPVGASPVFDSSFINTAGASLKVNGPLVVNQGFTNYGTAEITTNPYTQYDLTAAATIVNAPGGTITTGSDNGMEVMVRADIDNQGTINNGANTIWNYYDPAASANSGTINVTGGQLILAETVGTTTFSNSGMIRVAGSQQLVVGWPGLLVNSGTLTGSGIIYASITSTGTVDPVGPLAVRGAV